ncbi:MAG TPA: hypothetical protein VJ801_02315, partial [Polyangia bacterium]|nr:hypothetical protein [Polyangia bacterium]
AAARKPKQRRFPREAAFLAGERAGYSGVQWCRQTYQSSEDVLAWFRGWLAGQRQLMVLGELPECMDPNVWLERRRAERTAKEAS